MTNFVVIAGLVLLTSGCASQMVEQDAKNSCKDQGKRAFILESKQRGIPLVYDLASAKVLCVDPNNVTHLPGSFGADAFSAGNFSGAGILSVSVGSVAEKAAIKAGDIVSEFSGRPIANANELKSYIERVSPGDQAVIKVLRNGKEASVTAKF